MKERPLSDSGTLKEKMSHTVKTMEAQQKAIVTVVLVSAAVVYVVSYAC